MKKSIILSTVLAVASSMAVAQTGITQDVIRKLQSSYTETVADKAIRRALSQNSIASLTSSANGITEIGTDFSDIVPTKGITNQQSSGRCWLFTGLNVLRAKAITRWNLPGLELSQNYLFFYDQLEKANLFLQGVVDTRKQTFDDRMVDWLFQNPLSDGGTFCGVADLVQKYGVMPKEAFPETYQSSNTSGFTLVMKTKLREMGLQLREKGNNTKTRQSDKAINADLEKMFGSAYTMEVYTLSGDMPLAFNALDETTAANVVALGYRASEAGTYTLELDADYVATNLGGLSRLELTDAETGIVTDLLTLPYSFETARTQSENRFSVRAVFASEVTTSIDTIGTKESARKELRDGVLIIRRGNKVYSVLGQQE